MIFLKDEKSNINAKFGPIIMIWSVLFIILSKYTIAGGNVFIIYTNGIVFFVNSF